MLWAMGLAVLLTACASVPSEPTGALDWPSTRKLAAEGSAWNRATPKMRIRAARAVEARMPDFRFLRMEAFTSGDVENHVALFKHEPTGMEFSLVPGGFIARDPDRSVSAGFLVARTEVPQSVWTAVLPTNPSSRHDGDRPVEGVSWTEATGFCRSLGLSLPTSDQWELACRAGTTTRYSFGDDAEDLADYAWFDGNTDDSAHPVALLEPNAYGLYDVHGNVREWCKDRVGGYGLDERRSVALRVVRGGAWNYDADQLGCSVRNWGTPDTRSANIGLRPVRSLAGR